MRTIADQLMTRRIYDIGDARIWTGFVVFCAFALGSASAGAACDLLLRLPAPRLEAMLKEERMLRQDARAKLADFAGRLRDRVLHAEVRRVLRLDD